MLTSHSFLLRGIKPSSRLKKESRMSFGQRLSLDLKIIFNGIIQTHWNTKNQAKQCNEPWLLYIESVCGNIFNLNIINRKNIVKKSLTLVHHIVYLTKRIAIFLICANQQTHSHRI